MIVTPAGNQCTYRYAIDTVRNQIELIQGSELNADTYVSTFPNIKSD